MSRILTILSIFFLAIVLTTAGCIITDTESQIPSIPPLTGDPIVGTWTGTLQGTSAASGSGEITTTTTTYTITIEETGDADLSYKENKKKGMSSTTNERAMPGTVSKADNVYTIAVQLLGKYTITLGDDGKAELTTPDADTCQLEKQP